MGGKATGRPRGRPKGSKDIAPLVKEIVKAALRGEAKRVKKDIDALPPRERIYAIRALADLGISLEKPTAKAEGVTVIFKLSGVREGDTPTVIRLDGVPQDDPAIVDVTPPALPPAESSIDPRLWRRGETSETAAVQVPVVPEKTPFEKEQERLRIKLDQQLAELDRNPIPSNSDWRW